ncbi:nuclear transport factor 2 family protein [Naasia lichenicola]|nr:DUF4440 domain-containing protein [Naasia lichenicola]
MPDYEDLAEATRLELLLIEPEVRADPHRLTTLLHADFVEFGASGRRWDRAGIIAALSEEAGDDDSEIAPPVEIEELEARAIAPAAILVTYIAERSGRRTRRSSIWTWSGGGWSVLFHQGTVIPESFAEEPAEDGDGEPATVTP